jgi:hypothetical protein
MLKRNTQEWLLRIAAHQQRQRAMALPPDIHQGHIKQGMPLRHAEQRCRM